MRKRILLLCGALLLVALDWAALHDIVRGNEPDLSAEWTTLGASAVVLAAITFARVKRVARAR